MTGISQQEPKQALLADLDDFVFFHLGADAGVESRENDQGMHFCIQHERVKTFDFDVTWEQIQEMTADPKVLEDYLLEYLARYRG